eukprot:297695-Chlamydomonas_euryale.AAC.2
MLTWHLLLEAALKLPCRAPLMLRRLLVHVLRPMRHPRADRWHGAAKAPPHEQQRGCGCRQGRRHFRGRRRALPETELQRQPPVNCIAAAFAAAAEAAAEAAAAAGGGVAAGSAAAWGAVAAGVAVRGAAARGGVGAEVHWLQRR